MPTAAIVTTTEETFGSVKKVKFSITSSDGGVATATTTQAYSGEVLRLVIVPGADALAPTALFDIEIMDDDGYDILAGQGANLSNAATTTVIASMGCVANDQLHLSASGMGDANGATVIIYIR
jgi:hypothetical protein